MGYYILYLTTILSKELVSYSAPLYPQNVALTSPTSGGRSAGIVRLRTNDDGVFVLRPQSQNILLYGGVRNSLLPYRNVS
jgi:hypothetical protein